MAEKKRKAKPKTAKKTGRPRLEFDMEQVLELAKLQCTYSEIAAVLGCCTETVERRIKEDPAFCATIEKGREEGKSSLRKAQFAAANAGNVTMMIWLGKQYLGQSDRSTSEITGKGGGPVEFSYTRIRRKLLPEVAS